MSRSGRFAADNIMMAMMNIFHVVDVDVENVKGGSYRLI